MRVRSPTYLQHRNSASLSYDYIMVKGRCSNFSPAIIDTDGALRWVGTGGQASFVTTFFDNAVYLADGARLYRNDFDGTVTECAITVIAESVICITISIRQIWNYPGGCYPTHLRIGGHRSGRFIRKGFEAWNLAAIISAAMSAGGDDPSQFVFPEPTDWFHNNGVA